MIYVRPEVQTAAECGEGKISTLPLLWSLTV